MPRILVLLLALIAPALHASALDLPPEKEKWITLAADDIRIYSNASPAATLNVARELLRMREAVGRVTQLKTRSAVPTKVFLFANEKSFAPYRDAAFNGRAKDVTGAFTNSESANYILLQGDSKAGIDRVVFHELTHLFVTNTSGEVPLWLSEGIAEYYSTFRTDRNNVHIGVPVKEHVHWLRNQSLIPLRDLFSTTHDSDLYNESDRAGVFYAQSWALVHYLVVGNEERRPQLSQFFAALRKGETVDNAFTAAFGVTYTQMEDELRAYVRKPSMKYNLYALDELKIDEPPQPEPLARDELHYELGHFIAQLRPELTPTARRFLDEALLHNPKHAGAYSSIGQLYLRDGRFKEADAAMARAAELGSDDPMLYLNLGHSALTAEDAKKARTYFTKATELDPNSARAWLGIAWTYLDENDVAPGIEAAAKARALGLKDDNLTQAIAMLQEREHVRVINQAITAANDGSYADAVAMLDKILPELADKEMQVNAQKLRDDLAKRVKR